MLIITDEDVPDDVARFLASRGHTVLLAREHFIPGSPDAVIAKAASERGALVVTWNRRHFKNLAKKRRKDGTLRHPHMSVLTFSCAHPRGLARLAALIEEIESIYDIRVARAGGRLIADIGDTVVRYEEH